MFLHKLLFVYMESELGYKYTGCPTNIRTLSLIKNFFCDGMIFKIIFTITASLLPKFSGVPSLRKKIV
jgi:hypothetical protein